VKWWRKAAKARQMSAQWLMGLCYYYGRGVARDVAQAMVWFRKSAAQGQLSAAEAVQFGIPGHGQFREMIARFTNADSAPPRHAAAHNFAEDVHARVLIPYVRMYNNSLQQFHTGVLRHSVRDSLWVDFMFANGVSDEELELAKQIYANSLRTCTFCGSSSVPLRKCSLCMELRYCINTECQHARWNATPAAESHKVLCPHIFVRGSKGRTRRA
jgi:TPR repeat protein